jgi:hypothetical protein
MCSSPWIVQLCVAIALAACSSGSAKQGPPDAPDVPPERCDAVGDEDGNGLADCADPACAAAPACQVRVESCSSPGDEDGNGLADCADPACAAAPACRPPIEVCTTIGDEDGNGVADCCDPACATAAVCQQPHHKITLIRAGLGQGSITATIGGVVATCLDHVPDATVVTLTATADPGSWFRGWQTGCTGRHACEVVASGDLTVTGELIAEPNRVFMSSRVHDGNFGGIAAGDAICQQLATEAGLTGSYRILVSSATEDWTARLGTARGWIRPDGEPVGDTTIGGDAAMYNVRLDERGRDVGATIYWAPRPLEGVTTTFCAGWTSNSSTTTGSEISFFAAVRRTALINGDGSVFPTACSKEMRFLCAEVDRRVEISPIRTSGRLAFVTKGTWKTSTGVASADALCGAEASAAGKTGSFKALLATSTASAISRFDTSGAPWVRVDGMPLLATAAAFQTAKSFDIAAGVRLDGSLQAIYTPIPLAGRDFHTPAPADRCCSDWTMATNTAFDGFEPWSTDPNSFSSTCGMSQPVLCLEE